ncbi:hypothetical protein AK812_SmicGene6666 [Symbiodinium microadriaticum]|uniref:Uncharacterized protein n=1 Tax=Symbiodinium microadriaticum TaxID=2951 RepID=A0A1Q9EQK0_SYMMI|nr:hypothetical protein AK812_SmicGene6666 [Symbiodinium microadriaticum]
MVRTLSSHYDVETELVDALDLGLPITRKRKYPVCAWLHLWCGAYFALTSRYLHREAGRPLVSGCAPGGLVVVLVVIPPGHPVIVFLMVLVGVVVVVVVETVLSRSYVLPSTGMLEGITHKSFILLLMAEMLNMQLSSTLNLVAARAIPALTLVGEGSTPPAAFSVPWMWLTYP